jgi:hypothetical protein
MVLVRGQVVGNFAIRVVAHSTLSTDREGEGESETAGYFFPINPFAHKSRSYECTDDAYSVSRIPIFCSRGNPTDNDPTSPLETHAPGQLRNPENKTKRSGFQRPHAPKNNRQQASRS